MSFFSDTPCFLSPNYFLSFPHVILSLLLSSVHPCLPPCPLPLPAYFIFASLSPISPPYLSMPRFALLLLPAYFLFPCLSLPTSMSLPMYLPVPSCPSLQYLPFFPLPLPTYLPPFLLPLHHVYHPFPSPFLPTSLTPTTPYLRYSLTLT